MKIRASVIAAGFVVLQTAFPISAKPQSYQFWYGFNAGGLAALCDLYLAGVFTSDVVEEASRRYLKKRNDEDHDKAAEDAFVVMSTNDAAKDCPIRQP